MFLTFIGITLVSLAFIKLGTLFVWVTVLALTLKLSIAAIFVLAGPLLWNVIKRH